MLVSAYKYRLYPTKEQEATLNHQLSLCAQLYNGALSWRIAHYKQTGAGLSYVTQQNALPALKKETPEYGKVYSQVLQDVLHRVDRSYINFFEGRTRYPHFKKSVQSITYPQVCQTWVGKSSITLPKFGGIRAVIHRAVKGKAKTLTVKRYKDGKWYAIITVETGEAAPKPLNEITNPVGIDSGLLEYIYMSDGEHVENPRFLKGDEKRIRKAQKALSRKEKRSNNGEKARVILAKRWQDYLNIKNDWQWKLANRLVNTYDFIAYEDLSIVNMVKNHSLAKSIQDASWAGFWDKVKYRARTAGVVTYAVSPRYTTQECPECHERHRAALSERTFVCPGCGYTAPRDRKSAIVILQRAFAEVVVGMGMPEFTPVEIGPTPFLKASPVVEAGNKLPVSRRTGSDKHVE